MITRKAVYYAGLCLLAIVAALWVINTANSVLSYVPFTDQYRARQLSGKAGQLKSDVSRLEREATGNAEIGRAVETYHRETVVYRDLQTQAETEARSAPNAATPVADERVARLSDHERRVCVAAGLDCTTIDAARGRTEAVPSDGASGQPDAG